MNINISFDSSVSSAPVGFTATIASAVSFLETNYTDPVTINVDVGYGEIAGQALAAGALGESQTSYLPTTYGQIRSALIADAQTANDTSAVASLPSTDPAGGNYFIATAEAKALGLYSGSGIDGYVGFRAGSGNLDFDRSDGISPGAYDFFGVVLHEITEVMGRQLFTGATVGGTPNSYQPEDLFHYSAAGVRTFQGTTPGYFSVDDGATNLVAFNTSPSGDFGDWAGSAGVDSYRAFAVSGTPMTISDADMIAVDAIGWDEASLPDLAIGTFAGGATSVSVRIDNIGKAGAAASNAGIYLSTDSTITTSDTLLANIAIGPIAAGGSDSEIAGIVLPSNLTPGTYYLGAFADTGDAVVEIREFDNSSAGVAIILGNDGDNSLTGTTKADTMVGFAGNDTLNGGAGGDTLIGGGGDDRYIVDSGLDSVIENPGEGTDSVQASVSYTLSGNVENLTLTGSAALNGTGNTGDNSLTGNAGNNILTGLSGADTLDGAGGLDTASYAASAQAISVSLAMGTAAGGDADGDVLLNIENLTGSAFNDTVEGSAGNNVLIGGAGIDTLSYEHAGAAVKVSLALTTAQNTAGAGTDSISLFENLLGSAFDDTLIGSTAANVLTGGSGQDCLDGGAGGDTMIGGLGDDRYVVDASTDSVIENAGEGTDSVQASASYTLSSNVENLTLTGSAVLNGMGNAGDNSLTGNSGNNILTGLAGADTLDGAGGLDTVSYAASAQGVSVSLAMGTAAGGDADGDVLLNIENLTGSAFNDTVEGSAGNNVLIGGAGIDTLSYEHAGAAVKVSLALTTAQNTVGAGTDSISLFENLLGSAFDDTLTGSTAVNVLTGGSGHDCLDGGAGADTMIGGAGDDFYVADKSTDLVSENPGEGTDTVLASVAYTLAANVENLTLTGATAINGTGNADGNAITGNSGNNVLIGLGGADSLDGAAGVDTASYAGSVSGVNVSLAAGTATGGDATGDLLSNIENVTGSSAADTIEGDGGNNVLNAGAGVDLLSYAHAAGGVSVNLSLTTAQNTSSAGTDTVSLFENLTGSAFNDSLTGSSGANLINGGDGDDSLDGGVGADTLNGGAGADVLTGGTNADRFQFTNLSDFATGTLDRIADFSHSQLDKIDLTAIDANANVAGDQAFTFIGNAGFHAVAGELNYASTATGIMVSGDVNGDGVADFSFNVDGLTTPVSADFLL